MTRYLYRLSGVIHFSYIFYMISRDIDVTRFVNKYFLGSGFYSISDYQKILKVAAANHVQVIPEIDMPGHCHAAIRSMEAR